MITDHSDIEGRKGIGYWTLGDDDLPDPRDYIDLKWDPLYREAVVFALKAGWSHGLAEGQAKCQICDIDSGPRVLGYKDGPVWPESFVHYVADHGVRPPDDFVYFLLSQNPNELGDGSRIDFESKDQTRLRLYCRIMLTPDPMSENPPWRKLDTMEDGAEKWAFLREMYGYAGDTFAKAFYLILGEQPELIEKMAASDNFDKAFVLYDAVEARWPGFDRWLGGSTGFMVGFAAQIACFVREAPPPPNPAVWTVVVKEG